jgi:hypothetical protein
MYVVVVLLYMMSTVCNWLTQSLSHCVTLYDVHACVLVITYIYIYIIGMYVHTSLCSLHYLYLK